MTGGLPAHDGPAGRGQADGTPEPVRGTPPEPVCETPPRDPGVQPERTWLAWRRTTLTYAVSVGLAARVAVAEHSATAVAAAALGAVAWAALLLTAQRRRRGLAVRQPAPMDAVQVIGTLASVLVLIVVGGMLL